VTVEDVAEENIPAATAFVARLWLLPLGIPELFLLPNVAEDDQPSGS
jgi:hypothetical protein